MTGIQQKGKHVSEGLRPVECAVLGAAAAAAGDEEHSPPRTQPSGPTRLLPAVDAALSGRPAPLRPVSSSPTGNGEACPPLPTYFTLYPLSLHPPTRIPTTPGRVGAHAHIRTQYAGSTHQAPAPAVEAAGAAAAHVVELGVVAAVQAGGAEEAVAARADVAAHVTAHAVLPRGGLGLRGR